MKNKQQLGKQNFFQWEVLNPLHGRQNQRYLLLWSLWGATGHEAATFLRCRGHLAFIHNASCLWPVQVVHSTNHNIAGHHLPILHILHKAKHFVIDNLNALQTLYHHESMSVWNISYHLSHDLATLLPKDTTIIADRAINYWQDFKIRYFF